MVRGLPPLPLRGEGWGGIVDPRNEVIDVVSGGGGPVGARIFFFRKSLTKEDFRVF